MDWTRRSSDSRLRCAAAWQVGASRAGGFNAVGVEGGGSASQKYARHFAGSEHRKAANGSAAPLGRVIFFWRCSRGGAPGGRLPRANFRNASGVCPFARDGEEAAKRGQFQISEVSRRLQCKGRRGKPQRSARGGENARWRKRFGPFFEATLGRVGEELRTSVLPGP